MDKTTRAAAEKIAHQIVRQMARRVREEEGIAGTTSPRAMTDAALRLENIDGRIEGLYDALGVLLGHHATASDIADLTA